MTEFTNVHPALSNALCERGYERATPVQASVLGADSHRDLLVSAQTGSGKTVAFGLAMAPNLFGDEATLGPASRPAAVIIAPTRELALQVARELTWLYAGAGAVIATCVGGMDMRRERRALEDGAHVVVGTPGRLRDHITRHALDLSGIVVAVLDEADEMLDLGFREDLEFILEAAPSERRTLLFSATVPPQIADLARRFQRNADRLDVVGDSDQHQDIEYRVMKVAPPDRDAAVVNTLLLMDGNALVFCATREAVRRLASRLSNRGFAVVSLSGELSQAERTNALQAMRDGRARVCVATDVAARGIDLPNLDLVIHAELPGSAETLLHRSGRTGRAGRKGICVLIVPHHRRGSASRLLRSGGLSASPMTAPTPEDIAARERERILSDEVYSAYHDEDERAFARELLEAHGAENVALAYLAGLRASRPAAEELATFPIPAFNPLAGERPGNRFEGGAWFTLSLGRQDRAEPRWLLPLICKAGRVTKSAVGSIRILDNETRFEISTDKAEAFAAAVMEQGPLERGATITRLLDPGAEPAQERRPHRKGPPRSRSEDHRPPASARKPARTSRPTSDGARTPRLDERGSDDRKPYDPDRPRTAKPPKKSAADTPRAAKRKLRKVRKHKERRGGA